MICIYRFMYLIKYNIISMVFTNTACIPSICYFVNLKINRNIVYSIKRIH